MAPTLQCPECGHREPVDNVSQREQFRCGGCGRSLKVPESLRPGSPSESPVATLDPSESTARVFASSDNATETNRTIQDDHGITRVEREAIAAQAYAPSLTIWVRLAVWAVWLPVGLGVTFYAAIKLRWLNEDHLFGTLGKVTWDRFVPIGRLLPIAALFVAVLVHGTMIALERRVGKRRLSQMLTGGPTESAELPQPN